MRITLTLFHIAVLTGMTAGLVDPQRADAQQLGIAAPSLLKLPHSYPSYTATLGDTVPENVGHQDPAKRSPYPAESVIKPVPDASGPVFYENAPYGETCESSSVWFAGLRGLIFNRDRQDHFHFSVDDTDESIPLLDVRDASMDYSGGFEVNFGRYFGCGSHAVEAVYWGLFPDSQESLLLGGPLGGNLNGVLNWDQLDYNGAAANTVVDAAVAHRLRRDFEMHNVELNVLGFVGPGIPCSDCGSPWRFEWATGFRYFRFSEELQFAADTVDAFFTGDAAEIYYDVDLANHLIGWQLGGRGQYAITDRLSTFGDVKFGIFGNHIRHFSRIGGAAGDAVVNNGPNVNRAFREDNHKNDVSFLGELELGLRYRIYSQWRLVGGYRAMAITGVALPSDQIPSDLRAVNELPFIASDGSVVLHGAFAGLEIAY